MKKLSEIQPITLREKINKYIASIEEEMEIFFGIGIEVPEIIFMDSRKEIDDFWHKKTESWLSAWAKNGNIYILNPDVYTKESDHSIAHFWEALKHEYSHLYFATLSGVNRPKWLNEGLANYLAGQKKREPTEEEKMKVFDYFRKADKNIYHIGYFWVKLLIEKFGKEKLLKLLKEFNAELTEKQFAKYFYKTYGIKYTKKGLNDVL